MADNNKKIQQVNIIDNEGDVYSGVRLAPDTSDIIVKPTGDADASSKATLEEFLFSKFDDTGAIRKNVQVNGEKAFYPVAPSSQSIWQWLTDHQDIVKKRMIGLYDTDGNYLGDFLLAQETDTQADYTLMSTVDADENIEQVCSVFNLSDDKKLVLGYNAQGQPIIAQKIDYTSTEQAEELMMAFGEKSFWQAYMERELDKKQKLIGVYKKQADGSSSCIGYFEATESGVKAIRQVYDTGFTVALHSENGEVTQVIRRGTNSDAEALAMAIDLESKSVYQHLIELKDFWITLPFEVYNNLQDAGVNIANKYDITDLHFAD